MSISEPATNKLDEGPGPSTWGIVQFMNSAEKSSKGPSNKSGGITGSGTVVGKGGVKRKLDTKSYGVKYEAIIAVEKGKKKNDVAVDFGIPKSTLSTWLKHKDDIKSKYLSGEMGSQRKKDRSAKYPDVEDALLKWFKNARDQNVPISGEILREKAKSFASKLGVPEQDFECSTGWVERFKGRHNIAFKKVCGESKSVEQSDSAMTDWQTKLASIVREYHPDDIYNADETGLFFRLLPDRTLEFKNVSCHGGKMSKDQLTVMVCANMSGTNKLPLLVIGKSRNPRCFKNVKTLPTEYYSNKKAWMTSEMFTKWLQSVDQKMTKKKRKIVMIVDNCPAHPSITGLTSVTLVFLPPNTTSVTQPMDQGVIKNLKCQYRKLIIKKKIRAIDTNTELSISVLDALRMLREAWNSVNARTIENCFRHAGFIKSSVDLSDELSSDNDDPDDDIPLARIMRLGFGTVVSIEDYTVIDNDIETSECVTEDSIVNDIISSRNVILDNSDNEDDDVTSAPVTRPFSQVLDACDIIRDFLDCSENSEHVSHLFSAVTSFITSQHLHRFCTNQSDITDFFQKTSKQD